MNGQQQTRTLSTSLRSDTSKNASDILVIDFMCTARVYWKLSLKGFLSERVNNGAKSCDKELLQAYWSFSHAHFLPICGLYSC